VAPAGTPKDIISTLHRATVLALNDDEVRQSLGKLGVDIVGDTPEEFSAYIQAEIPKWAEVIEESGAKAQ
jgi:tripartite-type tricarboxylate transporter receptor subunit TctC